MLSDMMKWVDGFVNLFKKPLYGRTFYCPVCHLELSAHDRDKNGCLVCPVCGVVIELYETYGHFVPVVNDVEIHRAQPKARLHPLATHLPVGLFPFAFLGALILLIVSLYLRISGAAAGGCTFCAKYSPLIDDAVLIMLTIAVLVSALTFLTGYLDWQKRYGGRSYRVITLKIRLSVMFLLIGIVIVFLHPMVFQTGIVGLKGAFEVLKAAVYYLLMAAGMFILATLGHVGGYLVFGK